MKSNPLAILVPVVAALLGAGTLFAWHRGVATPRIDPREPIPTNLEHVVTPPEPEVPRRPDRHLPGTGVAANLSGSWAQFRGGLRDGKAVYGEPLLAEWPAEGLRQLWRVSVGEGYAGAAIHKGRVYLADYDEKTDETVIRCLSLDDGTDIWRYTYNVKVAWNHGYSRTVPGVNDRYVVTIGPKCHVRCLDAVSGSLVWKKDMEAEFGTVVPQWYTGQCPLIDGERVILAPSGDPLIMAVDLASGEPVWQTPNPGRWQMTHSSVVPFEVGGVRQYVYCTTAGVVGVAADDGRILWRWPDWKILNAVSPSPLVAGPGLLLFTGDYNAGSQMVRVTEKAGTFKVEEVFRLKTGVFSCKQHTPLVHQGYLYTVLPNGRVVCADFGGRQLWTSPSRVNSGWAPFMFINDLLYILNDETGELIAARADSGGFQELNRAKVLNGHEAWAPMAFADGRLVVRDMKEMVCLDLNAGPPAGGEADDGP